MERGDEQPRFHLPHFGQHGKPEADKIHQSIHWQHGPLSFCTGPAWENNQHFQHGSWGKGWRPVLLCVSNISSHRRHCRCRLFARQQSASERPCKQSSSGKLVTDAMALMDIHCIYGPPMIFDDIVKSHSDDFNKYAGNTKMALFAGGESTLFLPNPRVI
jgi:hypothetical protein